MHVSESFVMYYCLYYCLSLIIVPNKIKDCAIEYIVGYLIIAPWKENNKKKDKKKKGKLLCMCSNMYVFANIFDSRGCHAKLGYG